MPLVSQTHIYQPFGELLVDWPGQSQGIRSITLSSLLIRRLIHPLLRLRCRHLLPFQPFTLTEIDLASPFPYHQSDSALSLAPTFGLTLCTRERRLMRP